MNAYYIIRLDDICPAMNWSNFSKIKAMLNSYNIKPLMAIIPDNKDKDLVIDKPNVGFWETVNDLKNKGWNIAQHGYQHFLLTKNGGILGITDRSEFASLPYQAQYEKIYKGQKILKEKGLQTDIWVAPTHSFDKTTCKTLKNLNFKYISDGIAVFPFEQFDLLWIPQQLWTFRKMPVGIFTICIHPNLMDDNQLRKMQNFIVKNSAKIISFHRAIEIYKNSRLVPNKYIWKIINCGVKIPFYTRLKYREIRKSFCHDNN